jgi:CBS domain-containing protein
MMVEKDISGLPVVDDTGLVGIISEKNVLKLLYETESVTGNVEEFMTTDVICFDQEDSLVDICNCLIDNGFRRVPVLNQGKLAGIISRADLIKANRHKFRPDDLAEESVKHKDGLLARDILKYGLFTVVKGTPVYEVMEIVATKNITGLPVVDDYMNLVGIITEKDILKLLYDPEAKPGKVADFMTENVFSFKYDVSLFDVCECLIDNPFRRVPILNHSNKLVGIISRADIIEYILRNQSTIFEHKPAN